MDKVDGIGDGGVMHGIVRAVDEAVYAWYGGAMGGREVYNDPWFFSDFLCCNADRADTVNGEGGV